MDEKTKTLITEQMKGRARIEYNEGSDQHYKEEDKIHLQFGFKDGRMNDENVNMLLNDLLKIARFFMEEDVRQGHMPTYRNNEEYEVRLRHKVLKIMGGLHYCMQGEAIAKRLAYLFPSFFPGAGGAIGFATTKTKE